jgi:hypothetical protein
MSVTRSAEHRIRDDLSIEFTFEPTLQSIEAHWNPRTPARLTPEELALYRRIRNEFMQQLAAQLGGAVLVLE